MAKNSMKPRIRFKGFTDAWEQRKLGDTIDFYSGLTYSPSDVVKDNGVFVLRSSNVREGEIVDEDNVYVRAGAVNSDNVNIGDIIVVVRNGSRSLIGKHAKIKKNMPQTVIGAFMTGLRYENSSYLNAVLNTSIFEKEIEKDLGATINQITTGAFKKMVFPFPKQHEQLQIGDFFEQIDNLITLHQRKYDKFVNIKKALLEKMFPQGDETTPKIRFKGFTDAWEQREFNSIAKRITEMTDTEDLPRVEYEDIVSGQGTLNKDINKKKSCKTGILFDNGDVLFGKLRPYLKNWLFATFMGIAVGDFWVLRANNADGLYIYTLLQIDAFQDIANQSTGTKMPRADWSLVSKQRFLTPTVVPEQRKIGEFFKQLDNLITLHQRQLEKLKNIKAALLEKMFV